MKTLDKKLTIQRAKIARMAKSGMSNKQIGDSLNITDKCVSFHLWKVYRKLKIKGRQGLRRFN